MRGFFQRHLDPVDRLGEVVFGLIMALCVMGACRLEQPDADNRAMLIGVLGCNLAWGIVDGVMFVFSRLFERGLRARLIRRVHESPDDETAVARVAAALDDQIHSMITPEERRRIYQAIAEFARRAAPERVRLRRDDLLGGIAAALLIMCATVPVVIPFLLVGNPVTATRLASGIALVMLFIVGCWWGRMVGAAPLNIGFGLSVLGAMLVIITIALGG